MVANALRDGASPYAPYGTDAGTPSFFVAVGRDDSRYVPIVRLLLEAGADPNRPDGPLDTPPLHMAPDSARVALLVEYGADLEGRGEYGLGTPLYRAAQHGFASAARELLRLGADPNERGVGGRTPLHAAVFYTQSPGAASALLAAGADVNARDASGATPLDVYREHRSFLLPVNDSAAAARERRDAELLAILEAAGAEPSAGR